MSITDRDSIWAIRRAFQTQHGHYPTHIYLTRSDEAVLEQMASGDGNIREITSVLGMAPIWDAQETRAIALPTLEVGINSANELYVCCTRPDGVRIYGRGATLPIALRDLAEHCVTAEQFESGDPVVDWSDFAGGHEGESDR